MERLRLLLPKKDRGAFQHSDNYMAFNVYVKRFTSGVSRHFRLYFKTKRQMRQHPRFLPAYSLTEAAHYLRLPPATLRVWTMGQGYRTLEREHWTQPIIELPKKGIPVLSFVNLIEAQVLRALRTKRGVSMPAVKRSLKELAKHDPPSHPLAFEDFLTERGQLFIERYGQLVNLSASGQIAMKTVLLMHLERVERDDSFAPLRFYPYLLAGEDETSKFVVVDPEVSFGRPVIAGTRIPTAEIRSRINAGETLPEVAEDLGQSEETVRSAILYEEAA